MKEFNRIRDILDLHHIHYAYHVNNRLGQWAGEEIDKASYINGDFEQITGKYLKKSKFPLAI